MNSAEAITTRDLYVLEHPRPGAAELGIVAAGEQIDVLGNDGAWWLVRCGGQEGFVSGRYTRCVTPGSRPLWSSRVVADGLHLLATPGRLAETLQTLGHDDLVTVWGYAVDNRDVWLRVSYADQAGYLAASQTCGLPPIVSILPRQEAFLQQLLRPARESQLETDTPVSVTMAQAIVESDWGNYSLQDANNFFGIRAVPRVNGTYAWGTIATGYVLAETPEWRNGELVIVQAAFRTYASLADSVRDHGLFLRTSPRFRGAWQYAAEPDAFAGAIAAAGYRTDADYGEKLIAAMRTFRLYQFDR